ncbi:hypothetical protein GMDG_01981 [Pseudogymnoascus destructans 20631-21]|uniref:Uncharacterized protein n=2 Tax=Pseudogymnoascus destructans TaxID=655981 RepID=L8FZ54_PSED2|nr:hypothetical protein GMDG_01981 [Pseudogymnoascus destructans 20631-21]
MAKLLFPLGLVTALLVVFRTVSGLSLTDLLRKLAHRNNFWSLIGLTRTTKISKFEGRFKSSSASATMEGLRRLSGLKSKKSIGQFQRVKDFFDFRQIGGAEDTPAQDWNAQDIIDANGNIVTIGDVPGYAEALAENITTEAWWSGDLTPVNGYYFSPIHNTQNSRVY